ncbi:MAG: DNA-binding protein [Acidobacteria bacterium]|nr:DNA-binding protein [Acidobacteriota bacterium]
MSEKTLFLAWQDTISQDPLPSRAWFPVAQLDADVDRHFYRFRYINGAKRAEQAAGFTPLTEFPDFDRDYQSKELFPLFQNRIMNRTRPDFGDYLHSLDLHDEADPIEILSRSGGQRITDTYEVFPKIEKGADGSFTCRFFLHGWRHINQEALQRLDNLKTGEELYVTLELTNPATRVAVQIQTVDYHMIGWAPRYLVDDLVEAMAEVPSYEAKVVQVNPLPVPSKQRVLVEMRGRWIEHSPMSGDDFKPLVF